MSDDSLLASASASKIDSKIFGMKMGQALSECSFLGPSAQAKRSRLDSRKHFGKLASLGILASDQEGRTPSRGQGPTAKTCETNMVGVPGPNICQHHMFGVGSKIDDKVLAL